MESKLNKTHIALIAAALLLSFMLGIFYSRQNRTSSRVMLKIQTNERVIYQTKLTARFVDVENIEDEAFQYATKYNSILYDIENMSITAISNTDDKIYLKAKIGDILRLSELTYEAEIYAESKINVFAYFNYSFNINYLNAGAGILIKNKIGVGATMNILDSRMYFGVSVLYIFGKRRGNVIE